MQLATNRLVYACSRRFPSDLQVYRDCIDDFRINPRPVPLLKTIVVFVAVRAAAAIAAVTLDKVLCMLVLVLVAVLWFLLLHAAARSAVCRRCRSSNSVVGVQSCSGQSRNLARMHSSGHCSRDAFGK